MPAYLGIDFGTSNTHVAFCNDAGAGQLVAVPIKIAGRSSNTSSVLRRIREGVEEIEAFGTVATDAWSQFDSAERKDRRLALGFKPDIAVSPAARADATAFLRKICEAVVRHPARSGSRRAHRHRRPGAGRRLNSARSRGRSRAPPASPRPTASRSRSAPSPTISPTAASPLPKRARAWW